MAVPQQTSIFDIASKARIGALVSVATILMIVSAAQAQTFTVLHNFTIGDDGGRPLDTLVMDQAGNLYGSTEYGGPADDGVIFKLLHHGSSWLLSPLYSFLPEDGGQPHGPITIGSDGTLYGTTFAGGPGGGGVVYRLRPPASAPVSIISSWSESVLHEFNIDNDSGGAYPAYPALIFDSAGNIYGTTQSGGAGSGTCDAIAGGGVVFELSPFGGDWNETVLYSFNAGCPYSGVVMDSAGNLYGAVPGGGTNGVGMAYELSQTQSGWQLTTLHNFAGDDGSVSKAGLIMDQAGNLYGATSSGGSGGGGVIYEISPSGGGWSFQVLYNLTGNAGPQENLTMDSAGNLYGTALGDGANEAGMVFELSPSNGVWTLTDLHDFSQDTAYAPYGGVTLDANGNVYGTTFEGGAYGYGTVWEITP